jgi:hypothetical protein
MDKALENFEAALQMNSEYEKAKSWHAKVLSEQAALRANANANSTATATADSASSSETSKPIDGTTAATTTAASTTGTGDSAATATTGTATTGTVDDTVIINTVPLTPETTNGLKKAHYDSTDAQA